MCRSVQSTWTLRAGPLYTFLRSRCHGFRYKIQNSDIKVGCTQVGAPADGKGVAVSSVWAVRCHHHVRDWSLITGRARGGGGACEVLPLRKRGAEKVLAMLKGGGGYKKFWVRLYAIA